MRSGDHGSHKEDGDLLTDAQATPASHSGARARRTPRGCRHGRALLAAFVVVIGAAASVGSRPPRPPAARSNWAPVHAGDFPDPSSPALGRRLLRASPPRTSPHRARRSTSRCRRLDRRGPLDPMTSVDALPTLGHGPSPATRGHRASPTTADNDFVMYYTATEARSGRPVHRRGDLARSRSARTRDTIATPVVCQNGIGYRDRLSTNGNYGGSIDPDIFTDVRRATLADLEERRQPHRH